MQGGSEAPLITVHHLEQSRSQRVLWLLEELGVEYAIETYARDVKTSLAPPELMKVHPLGKSPAITDGEMTMAESGAIIEYLLAAHGEGRMRPEAGTEAWRRYIYWMHYAEGSLMPYLVMKLVFGRVRDAPVPFFIKPVTKNIARRVNKSFLDPNLRRHVAYIEAELGQREWFAGHEITGADIQMSFAVEALMSRSDEDDRPNMRAWVDKVRARPAYKRAVERGGPFDILGS